MKTDHLVVRWAEFAGQLLRRLGCLEIFAAQIIDNSAAQLIRDGDVGSTRLNNISICLRRGFWH